MTDFSALSRLAQAACTTDKPDDFLLTAAAELAQATQADQAAVILFDFAENQIAHFVSYGPHPELIGRKSVDEWMEQVGHWARKENVSTDNVIEDDLSPAWHTELPTHPQLILPLLYSERISGVLCAARLPEKSEFSATERALLEAIASQIALVVEKSRLVASELLHRKQSETLQEVARVLNASLDQQRLLELILDQLARVIEYDSASIMLIKDEALPIVASRKMRSSEQTSWNIKTDTLPHIREVLEKRSALIISDTVEDDRWSPLMYSQFIRCWLGVPLVGKKTAIGLLNLDKATPNYYTHQDAALASVFAHQAAIAIENAQLYSAERRRSQQLDALNAIMVGISSELELPKLLRNILEYAVHLLDASGGDLALFDENKQDLHILVSHNMGGDYTGARMQIGEGAMGLAVQTQRAVRVDQYSSWENASNQYAGGPMFGVLAAPFLIGRRVVGAIGVVDWRPERRFKDADQYLLELFARHCAIAVENANLYNSTKQAAERRAILHQVSQTIVTASLDPEGVYQAIHQAAAQLMPAEAFVITQLDDDQQTLRAVYLIDRSGRAPSQSVPKGRGLSYRILESGQSIYIIDTLVGDEFSDALHFGDQEQVRSVIAVPMRLGGKVIGMISAQSYVPNDYSDEDLRLLEMLAAYAGIALDNARLLISTQQLAITDPLTEIYNRRHLFELGQREFKRARRFGHHLSVIMIDIDHFKMVNDRFGHPVGDDLLNRLAAFLRSSIRDIDIVGRYGGEEFTIILPETDLPAARMVAERLRSQTRETFTTFENRQVSITTSIGIAALAEEVASFKELVQNADEALLFAKNAGRDRVEVYPLFKQNNHTINMASPNE
jgi:diguanylate cyclase (GGDEF)-like protein